MDKIEIIESDTTKANKRYFGFDRNVLSTGVTSFLTDTSVKIIYSIMPMFLMSLGASKTSIALIEGIAESTASVFKVISGFWSDKIGKNKPFMLIGYGLSALILPLYAFVVNPLQVLSIRLTERIGKGIRTAPRDSLIASSVTNGATGKSFGLQKAMDNSGAIVGPLVSFGLLSVFPGNYRLILLLAGIPSLIAIIVIIFGIKEVRKNKNELSGKFNFRDFSPRFYYFMIIIFIFTLGNSTDALLMVKANESGMKVAFIPLVYMVTSIVSVIMAIPFGSLSDKKGKEIILVFGFFIYAIVYFGFGMTKGTGAIVILFAMYGIYSAATDGIQKAFISDLVDSNKKGTAMGIYNALLGITLLPASLIAGILYDKIDSNAPFYFGATMSVIAALSMIWFIIQNKKQKIRI